MQSSAVSQVKSQMTQREIRDLLGEPERVVHSEFNPSDTTWVYLLDGEHCLISFRLGMVAARPACQSRERRSELEEIAIDREPGARARIKAEERKRKLTEEEANRFTRHLREPER